MTYASICLYGCGDRRRDEILYLFFIGNIVAGKNFKQRPSGLENLCFILFLFIF